MVDHGEMEAHTARHELVKPQDHVSHALVWN